MFKLKTLRTGEKLQKMNSDAFRKLWHLEPTTFWKQTKTGRKEKQPQHKQAGAYMCWGKSVKMPMGPNLTFTGFQEHLREVHKWDSWS